MHCIQVRTRRVPYFCRPEGDLRKSPAKRLDATQHVCALSAVGAGALFWVRTLVKILVAICLL